MSDTVRNTGSAAAVGRVARVRPVPARWRAGVATLGAFVALAVLVGTAGAVPALHVGPLGVSTQFVVRVDTSQVGAPLNRDVVGFNWRTGSEGIAALRPRLVRTFAVDLAKVAVAPGRFDFRAADLEVDDVEATGATPLLVVIGRPSWARSDMAVYRTVFGEVVRHYAVDRPHAGHPRPWFESGNEPEFPPTAHGELPQDLPVVVAAQTRAIEAVEAATGVRITYGGPAALFPDPAVTTAFLTAAITAGRVPDFVSWHAYSNLPLLGPDAPEDTSSAASVAVWQLLHGTNPAGSPEVMLGVGTDLVRAATRAVLPPGAAMPRLLVSEWNLSSGGLDHRNDTAVGAAHALAALTVMAHHRVDGAMYFAATDRYCGDPAHNPAGTARCGDWGVTDATGARKPAWWAFWLWNRLDGRTARITGAVPLVGLYAIATTTTTHTRVLVTSFVGRVAAPRKVRVRVGGLAPGRYAVGAQVLAVGDAVPVRASLGTRTTSRGHDLVVALDMAPNSAVLLDLSPS